MIYLASPYTSQVPGLMQQRFRMAETVTAKLLMKREHVYSPIVHCHAIAVEHALPTDFEFWKNYNLDMLRRCDKLYILSLEGWLESKGVQGELAAARAINLPCFLINTRLRLTKDF